MIEYFDVLVSRFEPGQRLKSAESVETAWGPAYREEQAGRFYWNDDLYVISPPLPEFLRRMLPEAAREQTWVYLCIGGRGIADFENSVRTADNSDEAVWQDHPLMQLLESLLAGQARGGTDRMGRRSIWRAA